MNAFTDHALADLRHAERYASTSAESAESAESAASAAPRASRRRRAPVSAGARRRLGVLLVEAGLHLMTRSEAVPGVSSPLAR
jgi:hypothetical protein